MPTSIAEMTAMLAEREYVTERDLYDLCQQYDAIKDNLLAREKYEATLRQLQYDSLRRQFGPKPPEMKIPVLNPALRFDHSEEAKYVPYATTTSAAHTYGGIVRTTVPFWATMENFAPGVPPTESLYDEPRCTCGRRHPVWERCRPLEIR